MGEDKTLLKIVSRLDKALEANRHEEAVQWLAQLRAAEPSNARWPHKQGELLRKLGRQPEAVQCYVTAVSLYADQGFIARAVAMAKTVVALDPSRIAILERVDPEAARQLRANKQAPRRAAYLDDGPLAPLPPAPAMLPTPAPSLPDSLGQMGHAGGAAATGRSPSLLPPPVPSQLTRSVGPTVAGEDRRRGPAGGARRPPPVPEPAPRRATRPRAAPPPPPPPAPLAPPAPPRAPAQRPKSKLGRLDQLSLPPMRELRTGGLASAELLELDPTAPADEVRFSNAPEAAHLDGELLSELDVAARDAVPRLESMRPQPISAQTLAKLPLFPLFAELPKATLSRMVARSELLELGHGALVVQSGAKGDALYGIVEGGVVLAVPGQAFQLTLAEGDVFGESCLLEDEKSQADAFVTGRLLALRVPRSVLLESIEEYPPLSGLLLELLTRRLLGNLLQVSPLFQDFDARGKVELARSFEVRRAAAGTMLAVVGKKMDALYIALTGSLRVNQPGAPERIAPAGSMFGQSTILMQEPSQVDVIACVDLILLRLPHAQFTRLAMEHPTILARLAELSTSEVVRVTLSS